MEEWEIAFNEWWKQFNLGLQYPNTGLTLAKEAFRIGWLRAMERLRGE